MNRMITKKVSIVEASEDQPLRYSDRTFPGLFQIVELGSDI